MIVFIPCQDHQIADNGQADINRDSLDIHNLSASGQEKSHSSCPVRDRNRLEPRDGISGFV